MAHTGPRRSPEVPQLSGGPQEVPQLPGGPQEVPGGLRMPNLSALAPSFKPNMFREDPFLGLDQNPSDQSIPLQPPPGKTEEKQVSEKKGLEEEFANVKRRNDFLEFKKDRLREKLQYADKIVQDLREKVKTLEREKEDNKVHSNEWIKDMKETNQKLQQEKQSIQMKMNSMKREYEERISNCVKVNESVLRDSKSLKEQLVEKRDKIRNLEFTIHQLESRDPSEKWIGNTLRLDWIIKEAAKVGAIRLPDHEWIIDMARDIEFPDTNQDSFTPSIYLQLPLSIRKQFLPDCQDAHMEWIEEEDEINLIQRLSEEASQFSRNIPQPLNQLLQDDKEDALKKIRLIQSVARAYISSKMCPNTDHAITIQRIFRGYLSRRIRYYLPVSGFLKSVVPPHLRNQTGTYNNPFLRRNLNSSDRRSLTFFNSGPDHYSYDWVRSNGFIQGSPTQIEPFSHIGKTSGTFVSHWFEITNHTQNWKKLIRIPAFTRYPPTYRYYFDLHTGINVSIDHFESSVPRICINGKDKESVGLYHPRPRNDIINTPEIINISPSPNIINRINLINRINHSDDEDESFQDRIQIAIQLSLEENNVDDDYGDSLFNMFN